jgi:hypothetical protein
MAGFYRISNGLLKDLGFPVSSAAALADFERGLYA